MHWIDTCDEERLKADIIREHKVNLFVEEIEKDSYYSNVDEAYEYIREYAPCTLPELERIARIYICILIVTTSVIYILVIYI